MDDRKKPVVPLVADKKWTPIDQSLPRDEWWQAFYAQWGALDGHQMPEEKTPANKPFF